MGKPTSSFHFPLPHRLCPAPRGRLGCYLSISTLVRNPKHETATRCRRREIPRDADIGKRDTVGDIRGEIPPSPPRQRPPSWTLRTSRLARTPRNRIGLRSAVEKTWMRASLGPCLSPPHLSPLSRRQLVVRYPEMETVENRDTHPAPWRTSPLINSGRRSFHKSRSGTAPPPLARSDQRQ